KLLLTFAIMTPPLGSMAEVIVRFGCGGWDTIWDSLACRESPRESSPATCRRRGCGRGVTDRPSSHLASSPRREWLDAPAARASRRVSVPVAAADTDRCVDAA